MAFGNKEKGEPTSNGKEVKALLDNGDNAENGAVHSKGSKKSKQLESAENFVPPDGGWGWMVCFVSFWVNGSVFGCLNTFGILLPVMMKEFATDENEENLTFIISWIGALQIFLTFFLSSFASILVDKIGIRPTAFAGASLATLGLLASSFVRRAEVMYLTYGLMLGMGSSIIYNPSLVILGHYFKRHLGVVNGLVSFGSAVFTSILPFLLTYLCGTIGLFWTFRVLAALMALLMVGSLSWIPKYQVHHEELDHYLSDEKFKKTTCGGVKEWLKKFLNTRIWNNYGYRVWALCTPIAFLGYFVPFAHLMNHVNLRMPGERGEILTMCIAFTSGVSRLLFGKLADLPNCNRIRMQQASFLVLGVFSACIPLAQDFWPLILITLMMGLADGCFICLIGPIAFDLLGPAGAAQGIGCMLSLASIPMTAGPPLAGLMFDYMGSYDIAFYAGGIPPIIAAILLFLIPAKQTEQIAVKQQAPVSMTQAIVAMSMENLDSVGREDDDVFGSQSNLKRPFKHLHDELYKPRSQTALHKRLRNVSDSDDNIVPRMAVSLSNLSSGRRPSAEHRKSPGISPLVKGEAKSQDEESRGRGYTQSQEAVTNVNL